MKKRQDKVTNKLADKKRLNQQFEKEETKQAKSEQSDSSEDASSSDDNPLMKMMAKSQKKIQKRAKNAAAEKDASRHMQAMETTTPMQKCAQNIMMLKPGRMQ